MPGLQWHDGPEHTWYKEFSRVLKPEGKLTIWADNLLLLEIANNGANPYFEILKEEYLYQSDLIALGSTTALDLADPTGKNIPYPLGIKIEMKKRRVGSRGLEPLTSTMSM